MMGGKRLVRFLIAAAEVPPPAVWITARLLMLRLPLVMTSPAALVRSVADAVTDHGLVPVRAASTTDRAMVPRS